MGSYLSCLNYEKRMNDVYCLADDPSNNAALYFLYRELALKLCRAERWVQQRRAASEHAFVDGQQDSQQADSPIPENGDGAFPPSEIILFETPFVKPIVFPSQLTVEELQLAASKDAKRGEPDVNARSFIESEFECSADCFAMWSREDSLGSAKGLNCPSKPSAGSRIYTLCDSADSISVVHRHRTAVAGAQTLRSIMLHLATLLYVKEKLREFAMAEVDIAASSTEAVFSHVRSGSLNFYQKIPDLCTFHTASLGAGSAFKILVTELRSVINALLLESRIFNASSPIELVQRSVHRLVSTKLGRQSTTAATYKTEK